MAREVERALSKLTAEAARTAADLSALRRTAEVLPMPIRIQLNNAIEELDLLRFHLHEATLGIVIDGNPDRRNVQAG
jgi:hypothetical protein